MSYQWYPPEPTRTSSNSLPGIPKSTSRNAIATGTVASRVRTLQNLAESPTTLSRVATPKTLCSRGESTLGFGRRRLASRFAPPASRKATPDQHNFETPHSFLGYKSPRINHGEGLASCTTDRQEIKAQSKDTSHRQLRNDGVDSRLQWPQETTANPQSSNFSTNASRKLETEDPRSQKKRFDSKDVRAHDERIPKPGPSPIQQPHTQGTGTLSSEISASTTSTMRRQSVRELFRDHGIQRPPGFASTANTSDEIVNAANSSKAHVFCHVCSFTNKHVQIMCLQCGHHFCADCPAVSSFECKTDASHNQREVQIAGTSSVPYQKMSLRKSSPVTGFPCSNAEILIQQKNPLKSSQRTSKAVSLATPQTGSRSSISSVNNSLIPSLDKESVLPEATDEAVQHQVKGGENFQCSQNSSGDPSALGTCESLGCQATHNGHRPYRHAVSCTKREPKMCNKVGTMRETLGIDDKYNIAQRLPPGTRPYFSSPHSRNSRAMLGILSDDDMTAEPTTYLMLGKNLLKTDQEASEYVECYGHPRTGHGHCGSPIDEGIVGDCQHCIDGCECLAFQSTPHTVRCCTNKDHSSVPHIHRPSQIRSMRSTKLLSSSDESKLLSLLSIAPNMKPLGKKQVITQSEIRTRQNAISITVASDKNRTRRNRPHRNSSTLSIEELQALEEQVLRFKGSSPVVQKEKPKSIRTVDISHYQPSKHKKDVSLESQRMQARQKDIVKEKLQREKMANDDCTNNEASKIDSVQLSKQLELSRQEKKKAELDNDDQLFPETISFFKSIEQRPKRDKRQRSPLCTKASNDDLSIPSGSQIQGEGQLNRRSSESVNGVKVVAVNEKAHSAECEKRASFQAISKGTDILGITVIVHMSNRDDLVFRVDAALAQSQEEE